jgi:hypothetical protein
MQCWSSFHLQEKVHNDGFCKGSTTLGSTGDWESKKRWTSGRSGNLKGSGTCISEEHWQYEEVDGRKQQPPSSTIKLQSRPNASILSLLDHNRTYSLMVVIVASYISSRFEVIGLFSIMFNVQYFALKL